MKLPFRRLQFSLRTMFVIVTLIAVFCGYEMNWIRQRREFLKRAGVQVRLHENDGVPAPRGLWLFGEKSYSLIVIDNAANASDNEAQRLFPEAELAYGSYDILDLRGNQQDVERVQKLIKSIEDGNPPVRVPVPEEPTAP